MVSIDTGLALLGFMGVGMRGEGELKARIDTKIYEYPVTSTLMLEKCGIIGYQ
jgi:hypothetical protein